MSLLRKSIPLVFATPVFAMAIFAMPVFANRELTP
jgi:hypothetical protein